MFKMPWTSTAPTRQTEPVVYPSGSFLDTGEGYWYIGKDSRRYRILSKRVLQSWNPARVILATEDALVKHKKAGRLGFREGTLLNNISDATIYLVVGNERRPITSPDVLERIGANLNEVIVISDDETKLHTIGEELK